MKNYSDLPATNTLIPIMIELEPIGTPHVDIIINNSQTDYLLSNSITITTFCELISPITISLILSNKIYTTEYETAVIIKNISIDNISIIPQYNHLSSYINDHNNNNPTNYLGFNGKWTLTIDQPFYQWLHQARNLGWLLD